MTNISGLMLLVGVASVLSTASEALGNDSFTEGQFWLSFKFQAVNWTNIIAEEVPFLNDDEGQIILNDAFHESVNPLIIITILSVNYDSHIDIHNETIQEFSMIVKGLGASLAAVSYTHLTLPTILLV